MHDKNTSISKRARAEKWKAHIDACQESGLTQSAYCRREHLNYRCFMEWKKRFKEGRQDEKSPLTLVKLEPPTSALGSSGQSFSFQQSTIRFWVNGYCVEVSNHFSPETLSQLIETLRRH